MASIMSVDSLTTGSQEGSFLTTTNNKEMALIFVNKSVTLELAVGSQAVARATKRLIVPSTDPVPN